MPAGTLGSGNAQAVPHRMIVPEGRIIIVPATFSSGVYVPPVAPLGIYDSTKVFGPVRDIKIDDPLVKTRQTAIGDAGECMRPIRKGEWKVSISAMIDLSDIATVALDQNPDLLVGDYRFGSLQHQIVDFLILQTEALLGIVFGVGIFEAGLTLPMADGSNVMRDVVISRRFGQTYGNLKWANMHTGAIS